jgi:hypothetical protein
LRQGGTITNSGVNTDAKTSYESTSNEITSDDGCCELNDSKKGIYIQRNATNHLSLVNNQPSAISGTLMMHSIHGQLIISKNVNLIRGINNIELPSSNLPQLRIVSLYSGQQLLFMQKVY